MEERSLASFEPEKDPITGKIADIKLQLYGNKKNHSNIRTMYINKDNLGIFNESEVDNTELRVRS